MRFIGLTARAPVARNLRCRLPSSSGQNTRWKSGGDWRVDSPTVATASSSVSNTPCPIMPLKRYLDGNRADAAHFVRGHQEVRPGGLSVNARFHAEHVLSLDQQTDEHSREGDALEVRRKVVSVRDVFEGFVADAAEFGGVFRCRWTQFERH